MNDDNHSELRGTTTRRSFLIGGSAVVSAVLLAGDFVPGPSGLDNMAAAAGPRISVGYVEGSAGAVSLSSLVASGRTRVVPAAGMRSGSADLAGKPVNLMISGFTPGLAASSSSPFSTVFLDAHIPSTDPLHAGTTVPFYAWTFRRDPAPMSAAPTRFRVGSGRGPRVGFSLDAAPDASSSAAPRTPATAVFTSGRQRGLVKLQPGIYLLGLSPGAWLTPRALPSIGDPAWVDLASMVVSVEAAPAA